MAHSAVSSAMTETRTSRPSVASDIGMVAQRRTLARGSFGAPSAMARHSPTICARSLPTMALVSAKARSVRRSMAEDQS